MHSPAVSDASARSRQRNSVGTASMLTCVPVARDSCARPCAVSSFQLPEGRDVRFRRELYRLQAGVSPPLFLVLLTRDVALTATTAAQAPALLLYCYV